MTACDEQCVGVCESRKDAHRFSGEMASTNTCRGWRCDGTGPAHRVPEAAPPTAPLVIVDPSQPAGSFALVSQSGRVEVVNVGAASFGETSCNGCGVDFKRQSADEIAFAWRKRGYLALEGKGT